jgi:hypothetical protein
MVVTLQQSGNKSSDDDNNNSNSNNNNNNGTVCFRLARRTNESRNKETNRHWTVETLTDTQKTGPSKKRLLLLLLQPPPPPPSPGVTQHSFLLLFYPFDKENLKQE